MFSWRSLPNRLTVIAHRGASAIAPENTLAAFQLAMDARADAIELDVRLTADGNVVVIHDAHLKRTTNGKGLVEQSSTGRIKSLSAGSWFGDRYSEERVPLLSEVLELVMGKIGIDIELKQEHHQKGFSLLKRTLAIIREHGAEEYILLTSFNYSMIKTVRVSNRKITTGVIGHPYHVLSASSLAETQEAEAQFLICNRLSMRKKIITDLHQRQLSCGVYTVNTASALQKSLRYGVDCIFTDNPLEIRQILSKNTTFGGLTD